MEERSGHPPCRGAGPSFSHEVLGLCRGFPYGARQNALDFPTTKGHHFPMTFHMITAVIACRVQQTVS